LSDERRMNVALTRARFVMIVVGNSETLSVDYNWKSYVDFIAENKCYFNAG
jgi:superfamily I DNA and/or RNA helicase